MAGQYIDIISGDEYYGEDDWGYDPYAAVDQVLTSGPVAMVGGPVAMVGARRAARGRPAQRRIAAPAGGGGFGGMFGMPRRQPAQAYPQMPPGMGPGMPQAMTQRMVDASTMYRNADPQHAYDQILPMQSTGVIAPGGAASITARPQTFAFQPHRVVIPLSLATDFIIVDMKVGNRSQFVQTGAVSAETFAQNAVGTGIKFDTVQTSQDFVIQVQNIGGAPRNFFATIFGASLSY